MRAVTLGVPMGADDAAFRSWAEEALREFERSSHEADVGEVADAYSANGTFTETRTVNVTAPTAANLAAVLATLLSDLHRRGTKHE